MIAKHPIQLRPVPAAGSESSVRIAEPLRVVCWRLSQLRDAGYSERSAFLLATRTEIDLHRAVEMVAHGCPELTALQILL